MDLGEAKRQLGIDRLALQIHDASFPSDADEDWGRGSPYSRGAERFFQFAANLGFDTIQLGPQGMTSRGSSSPYDGTLFSRNPLNLPLAKFVEQDRLSPKTFAAMRVSPSDAPLPYTALYDRFQTALAEIIANADAGDRDSARRFLAEQEFWLVPDALYAVLCREHGDLMWTYWIRSPQAVFDQQLYAPNPSDRAAAQRRISELRTEHAQLIEDYALVQWLLAVEHQQLRLRLKPLGISQFADLQVGLAPQDAWAWQGLFLQSYHMGAPPSRTNPDGQPWGYAVLDPEQLGTPDCAGPALKFVEARLQKVFGECDGVRIDHPHGWIDPWVYRTDDPDPFHAVQRGARLCSSPRELEHPQLSSFAIARAEQIDLTKPGYADHRVTSLDDAQVARYSLQIDAIVRQARTSGFSATAIACEVLSTLPYPVQRVLERHGLGRFRVTQKAKLDDPADVYRIENAQPADWIMMGTHDTPTIWDLAQQWCRGPEAPKWSQYLSSLLGSKQPIAADQPGELVHALFTAMLASRARNVMLFFPDLMGMTDRYNQPGLVMESNWRLRLPGDFDQQYEFHCRQGTALDVKRCLHDALNTKETSLGTPSMENQRHKESATTEHTGDTE